MSKKRVFEAILVRECNELEIESRMKVLLAESKTEEEFLEKCRKEFNLTYGPDILKVAWGKKLRKACLSLSGVPNNISAEIRSF